MNSTTVKAIEAVSLTKVYPPATRAVDGVTFSVDEGEVFGLLGPNGAGKTTIMRILSTLASVTGGEATVAGHDVSTDPAGVRSVIGVVPQGVTLDDELKGIENLMLSAKLHHVPKGVALERAGQLLRLVELEDAADKRVRTYSGGMKRRLQLTTALINDPRILFLDEPTVGLDIQTRTKIWDYLRRLSRDGLTVFMTTHYLEEADSLCDRIAIMDHGRIVVSGTPAELKEGLHGDVLTIEIAEGGRDITGFLAGLDGVSGVTRTDGSYRLKLPMVETALPRILASIAEEGLRITGTSFTKPTLDQVFLEVTGRSMRDAEEPGSGGRAPENPGVVEAVAA
ncbi:MAG: ATP-binding cassette domain-containing protein [Nitrososphaerales archaeon]|jgi:ABC-2 type transport system ATP-binding protein